jgi:hypothetical protein
VPGRGELYESIVAELLADGYTRLQAAELHFPDFSPKLGIQENSFGQAPAPS